MPRKRLRGTIKSFSGAKTVRVEVERTYRHPTYRKVLKARRRYLAHLEGEAQVGQEVVIEETRPLSARKHFRVVEIEGKPVEGGTQGGAFEEHRAGPTGRARGAPSSKRGRRFRKSTTRVPKEKKR